MMPAACAGTGADFVRGLFGLVWSINAQIYGACWLVSVVFAPVRAKVKWLQVMTGNGEQAEAARSASGGT